MNTKKYNCRKFGSNCSSALILFICAVFLLLPVLSGCNFINSITDNIDITADTPATSTSTETEIEIEIEIEIETQSKINAAPATHATAKSRNNTDTGNEVSHTIITPKDYISMSKMTAQPKKNRTVLIYMNGSDLESEYAAATEDLAEILDSRFDEKNINVVIFTGGAKRWHTPVIPDNINALFTVRNGKLAKLAQIGKDPMGYPETLAGFINFGAAIFPADKYGLILWNHGGGAIVGYGSDERYERNPGKAMMKLSEIDSALGSTDLYKNNKKLEFLGFDTCLMATLEMACIAQKYADYMIASEELEPDPGWDYYFMGGIKPNHSGKEIGKLIVDYYKDFYERYFEYFEIEDIVTMSLTDLSKMRIVSDAFEKLALSARKEIANGNYSVISKARSRSRMFGSRGEHAGETDMIDAGNLAKSLRYLIPKESANLINALNQAVIYKHETNIEDLGGLSIYFPFVNKQNLGYSLDVYRSINQLPEYTEFIGSFAEVLDSGPIVNYKSIANNVLNEAFILRLNKNSRYNINNMLEGEYIISLNPEQIENLVEVRQTTWRKSNLDGGYIQIEQNKNVSVSDGGKVVINFNDVCATLNGRLVCLYELDGSNIGIRRYAIPVKLNGYDADLIAVYSAKHPNGKIIGAVPTGDDVFNVLDKKIVRVRPGDIIQILYYTETFGASNNKELEITEINDSKSELWQTGEEFTVTDADGLILGLEKLREGEYLCGISFVDIQQNKYYSNFIEIQNKKCE